MTALTRRQFVIGGSSMAALGISPAWGLPGQEQTDARVAIIDTADDTRPWLTQLRDMNVRIIARYYARGCQPLVAHKRLTYNNQDFKCGSGDALEGASEVQQLLDNGFAILSIYQYNSGDPRKFLFGVDSNGEINKAPKPDTNLVERAVAEAEADAHAALVQAADAGQPANTAIYFGLDFNLKEGDDETVHHGTGKLVKYAGGKPVRNAELKAACQAYFRRVRKIIAGKYKIGLYGNGYTSDFLQEERLVDYAWISGATSFEGTCKVLRESNWHLYQNKADCMWFTPGKICGPGLDLDTNIQNPDQPDIGAWNRRGLFTVNPARTQAIFGNRCPAKSASPIFDLSSKPARVAGCRNLRRSVETKILKTRNVRVMEVLDKNSKGVWLKVDINEDGLPDGYCRAEDFAASIKEMPDYWA